MKISITVLLLVSGPCSTQSDGMFLQVHTSGFPAKFRSYEKYACASKVLNPTRPRQEALKISVLELLSVSVVEVKLAAGGPVLLTLSHWPLAAPARNW